MFCNKCGNQLPDTAKFCPKCGNKLAAPGAAQTNAAPNPASASQGVNAVAGQAPAQRPAWANNQTPMSPNPVAPPAQKQTWANNQTPMSPNPVTPPAQKQTWANNQTPMNPTPVPPPVQVPAEPPVEEVPAKKKKAMPEGLPAKPSAGKRVAAVFLCIFIFLFGLIASLVGAARVAYGPTGMKRMVRKVTVSELTLPGGDLLWEALYKDANRRDMEQDPNEDSNFLNEEYGISKNEFRDILDADFVKDTAAGYLVSVSKYLFNLGPFPDLSFDDIADTIKENEDEIEDIANDEAPYYIKGSDSDDQLNAIFNIDNLKDQLKEKGLKLSGNEYISESAFREYAEDYKVIGVNPIDLMVILCNFVTLIILVVVVIGLVVLLFVLLRWYLRSAFTRSGVTFIILGTVVLLCGAGIYVAANLFLSSTLLAALLDTLALSLLIIGGAVLVIGLLFVIVIRPLCAKREDEPAAIEEAPAEEPAV